MRRVAPRDLNRRCRAEIVECVLRYPLSGGKMTRYGTLRTWALFLKLVGVISLLITGVGVVVWAFEVEGFWETLGVILIGAPIALFFATVGIALGQALTAIADIGDATRPT